MDRKTALEIVKKQLTEQRYEHTVRVTDTAIQLAGKYGVDGEKAELAGILHDYAKFRPAEEMKELIEQDSQLPDDLLTYNLELWHAPVGAVMIEKETGLSDWEILQAIRSHTTGRAGMSSLEKVIFLADYIEPGRHFPGVQEVRDIAEKNLDAAVIQALRNTVGFLMGKGEKVYPDTIAAYNSLI
ncbi:MAG TPA: bis(5'-nucleosyl)-tetraphosphatase (symmetrical) YqeK [Bacillales bacterium]|nr:bis(5'-nucleosyl)-tetraphosphatase (symmetrical) YqeK [Bacillales bacterium]